MTRGLPVSGSDAIGRSAEQLLSGFFVRRSNIGESQAKDWLLAELDRMPLTLWQACYNQMARAAEVHTRLVEWFAREGFSRFPDFSDFRFLLGRGRELAGDRVQAEGLYRETLKRDPSHVEAAFALANLAREDGRIDAAGDIVEGLARHLSGDAPAQLHRAVDFLRQCGRTRSARRLCERALELQKDDWNWQVLAGDLALSDSDPVSARWHFQRALEEAPSDAQGHLLLALSDCASRGAPSLQMQTVRHWLSINPFSSPSRESALLALGRIADLTDDPASATEVWREARALSQIRAPWSIETWQASIAALLRSRVVEFAIPVPESFRPVLIVGLPSAGGEELAELLSCDNAVRDRGELGWLPFIFDRLANAGLLEDAAAIYDASRLYYAHVRQDDAPAVWYLDRNSLNFRYIGLFAAMFPNATVLHCRRNFGDNALKLWGSAVAQGDTAYVSSFTHIAAVAEGCEALMQHWRRCLPLTIHEVRYEALLERPEQVVDEIRGLLGLKTRLGADRLRGDRFAGRAKAYAAWLPELDALKSTAQAEVLVAANEIATP